jgi:hypothetical protein
MVSQRPAPELSDVADRIAATCRIVVQNFLPPEHWAEAERRFRLTVIGHLDSLPEGSLREGFPPSS